MLIELINKILLLGFFISLLNMIRHGYYMLQAMSTSTEETPVKYKITPLSLFLLGLSIAYVLTTIFTGFKI